MKKGKKILAAFLAVLMVVGIMPFTSFSGLFASKASAAVVSSTMPESVKFGEQIAAGSAKFVASQALTNTPHESGLTDEDGNKYTFGIKAEGKKNIKVNGTAQRAVGYVTATEDTEVVLTFVLPKNNKTAYIIESDKDLKLVASNDNPPSVTLTDKDVTLKNTSATDDKIVSQKISVKKGMYYYLVGAGTNLEVLGFSAEITKQTATMPESLAFGKEITALNAKLVASQKQVNS